jgi:hypothetical protein
MKPEAKHPRRTRRSGAARGVCLLVWLLLLAHAAGQPGERTVDERKAAALKAAYLRHLAEFTAWPDTVFAAEDSPIVIGVVGADPHGVHQTLDRAIRDGSLPPVQNRRIALRRFDGASPPDGHAGELLDCQMIFLARSERDRWPAWRALLGQRPIVTVGEMPGFADAGGMIEMAVAAHTGRIGLRINLGAVTRTGLRLSARLLGLKEGVTVLRENENAGEGPHAEGT